MILDFAWLPPEINSMRIFSGAGPGPLHAAALAWDGLAADLAASASSFNAVITGLTGGQWTGPASAAMAAAALPYQDWITTAADQADATAGLARTAASAFEGALTATVHPAVVDANRVSLMTLIATNFLGFNTPAIAANEFDYAEMWAQDVAAMVSYHGGATAVAASLTPFAAPPVDLASLAANIGAQFTGLATMASAAISPALQGVTGAAPGLVAGAQSAASALPIQSIASVAQLGAMPASMIMGPLMQAGQSATAGTAGLASATTGVGDPTKSVGDTAPSMKGLGGGAGLGAGTSGSLGQARMVGAMSVPPTWVGSAPKGMASSAMHGLGATPTAASPPAGSPTGGGMPMMPMPMGAGGAGAGMPGGMMGRGGASPHLTQNRPSVIPRTGIG